MFERSLTRIYTNVLCISLKTCFHQDDCKPYYCEINRIEPNNGVIITMVTRLWNHNLPTIDPRGVEMQINVEFNGPEKGYSVQREECKMSTEVQFKMDIENDLLVEPCIILNQVTPLGIKPKKK